MYDYRFTTRDVEAVEYYLLPLPAPYKVSRFQLLSSKCFRFHKNLIASGSSVCFQLLSSKCFPVYNSRFFRSLLVLKRYTTPLWHNRCSHWMIG